MINAILAAIPDVTPEAPPGLEGPAGQFLNWMSWGAIVAGMIGFAVIGIMMMVGRRNRSAMAIDAVGGIPWVFGGLVIVGLSGQLVGAVLA